jgi:hypothetical protein
VLYRDCTCVRLPGSVCCTTIPSTMSAAMTNVGALRCDGCGQAADAQHIARRLRRLEWATRFRPVHVQTLLLGGVAPENDGEFLYSPQGATAGEARTILEAAQIATAGKPREAVLAEFQKLGLLLTHVLECPLTGGVSTEETRAALQRHFPAAMARIRRSLKPKRVLLLSGELELVAEPLRQAELGCPVFPATGGTFFAALRAEEAELQELRVALSNYRV